MRGDWRGEGVGVSELQAAPAEFATAGRGVRESANQLEDRVKALSSRVEELLGGGWQGQASDAFRRDWQQWRDGARQVIGGLDTSASLLESSGKAYGEQDAANTDAVRRSGGSLNL